MARAGLTTDNAVVAAVVVQVMGWLHGDRASSRFASVFPWRSSIIHTVSPVERQTRNFTVGSPSAIVPRPSNLRQLLQRFAEAKFSCFNQFIVYC
jgi:hypothetical protein